MISEQEYQARITPYRDKMLETARALVSLDWEHEIAEPPAASRIGDKEYDYRRGLIYEARDELSIKIGLLKQEAGKPILCCEREKEILSELELAFPKMDVKGILTLAFERSRDVQSLAKSGLVNDSMPQRKSYIIAA